MKYWPSLLLLLLAGTVSAAVDFSTQIAPLLAKRCLECHSGAEPKNNLDLSQAATALKGGKNGPAIVPGSLQKSLLWEKVAGGKMPPKQPLSAPEKNLLREWILAGAKWDAPIDPFQHTTSQRAGYDWWSLQPVKRPAPATVKTATWPRTPIDTFVLAQLEAQGLAPSPVADKRTLIRRLSFDLLGLPPAPEAVAAFESDTAPDAYERLVERLLASPHYGERWARHWLDIARFGESDGFERDQLRDHSWRYRDWIVESFNRDLPYDQFAKLQIAGDILTGGRADGVIATGFLVAGAYDTVGQTQQSAPMRAVVRQDEMEDYISTVGETFLGLTLHCARCHDHKFDPVRQKEYYQMSAALVGLRPGQREVALEAPASPHLDARYAAAQKEIAAMENPVRAQLLAERKTNVRKATPPKPVAAWEFDGNLRDAHGALHGVAEGNVTFQNGALVLDGKSFVTTPALAIGLKEKTLEVWVRVTDLAQRGGAAISVETPTGARFDAIVFGERESKHWMAGSEGYARTQSFTGTEEQDAARRFVQVALVYQADGTIAAYRDGVPYGRAYKTGFASFEAGAARILFGLRHSPAGGNRFLTGQIDRARLYDRALHADEVAAAAGVESPHVSDTAVWERLSVAQRDQRAALKNEIEHLARLRSRAQTRQVYALAPRALEPTHLLTRGNPTQLAEVVHAGGVAAVRGVSADFELPDNAPEGERRARLAQWIATKDNPLFARVLVNRLWHYHFGAGLVETTSDFGFNGGRPSHPQLLDWLAAELVERQWSVKAMHRLLVNSAAYRQSSQPRADGLRADANNRLHWRHAPLRLDAESLRDTLLSLAGDLNPAVGGPGFHDFRTYMFNAQFYEMHDYVGPTFQRRSLYRTWVRSGRSQFLDAFDCPDPSAKAPKRVMTTTPLQSLALSNNAFVLRMADAFAARLAREVGADADAQVRRAFALAYHRAPAAEELAQARALVQRHGAAALARAIFNSNELLHVD